MSNLSVSEKRKMHALYVSRYIRKCTRAYQFVRNLHSELEKENLYLTIPVNMYNSELLGKYWRILPDYLENKLEFIEGKKILPPSEIKPISTDEMLERIRKHREDEDIDVQS